MKIKFKWNAIDIVFCICLVTSITMMVAGFCLPPEGVIDGSVLTAVGELFGYAALFQLPRLINGHRVELSHGNTSITVHDTDPSDDEESI